MSRSLTLYKTGSPAVASSIDLKPSTSSAMSASTVNTIAWSTTTVGMSSGLPGSTYSFSRPSTVTVTELPFPSTLLTTTSASSSLGTTTPSPQSTSLPRNSQPSHLEVILPICLLIILPLIMIFILFTLKKYAPEFYNATEPYCPLRQGGNALLTIWTKTKAIRIKNRGIRARSRAGSHSVDSTEKAISIRERTKTCHRPSKTDTHVPQIDQKYTYMSPPLKTKKSYDRKAARPRDRIINSFSSSDSSTLADDRPSSSPIPNCLRSHSSNDNNDKENSLTTGGQCRTCTVPARMSAQHVHPHPEHHHRHHHYRRHPAFANQTLSPSTTTTTAASVFPTNRVLSGRDMSALSQTPIRGGYRNDKNVGYSGDRDSMSTEGFEEWFVHVDDRSVAGSEK